MCPGQVKFKEMASIKLRQLVFEALSVVMEALSRQPGRYWDKASIRQLPTDLFQDSLPAFAGEVEAAFVRGSENSNLHSFIQSVSAQITPVKSREGRESWLGMCEAVVYTTIVTLYALIARSAATSTLDVEATESAIEECGATNLIRRLFHGPDQPANYASSFLKDSGVLVSFEAELQAAFNAILDPCKELASRVLGKFDDYLCGARDQLPEDLAELCGAHDQLTRSADTIRHLLESINESKVRSTP